MSTSNISIKPIIVPILLMASLFYFSACEYQNKEDLFPPPEMPSDTIVVSFAMDVFPIIEVSCATPGCHNTSSAAANIILDTYDDIKVYVDNGELLTSIKRDGDLTPMPLGGDKLPASQITLIETWIDEGALNN